MVQNAANVPVEAINYIKNKGVRESFSYKDVWAEQHYNAFTVAKSAGFDILHDIQKSLVDALEQGLSRQQFIKNLKPMLEAKGWTGRTKSIDPLTGKFKDFTINVERRLDTIFNVNMAQARAREFVKGVMADDNTTYLMYTIGHAKRHREDHVKLDGLVIKKTDPRLQTIMPPNGYGCHCDMIPVDDDFLEELKNTGIPDTQSVDENTGHTTKYKPINLKVPKLDWKLFYNERLHALVPKVDEITAGFEFPAAFYGNGLVLGQNMSLKADKIRQLARNTLGVKKSTAIDKALDSVMLKTVEGEIMGVYWNNIVDTIISNKNKGIDELIVNIGYLSSSKMANLERLGLANYTNQTIGLPTKVILKSGFDDLTGEFKKIKHDPSSDDGLSISQLCNIPKIINSGSLYYDKETKNLMIRQKTKATKTTPARDILVAIKISKGNEAARGLEVTSIYNVKSGVNTVRFVKITDKTKIEDLKKD